MSFATTTFSAHPGYVFRGKTYKSINGLLNALSKHTGATEISSVTQANTIEARTRADGKSTVIAIFAITPPVAGQKQYLAETYLPAEVDRSRRNALVASAYNVCVATRAPGTQHNLPGGHRMSAVGFPDEPRQHVMKPAEADGLPLELRVALLSAYAEKLMEEQATGQQMVYTFADCQTAMKFVNA